MRTVLRDIERIASHQSVHCIPTSSERAHEVAAWLFCGVPLFIYSFIICVWLCANIVPIVPMLAHNHTQTFTMCLISESPRRRASLIKKATSVTMHRARRVLKKTSKPRTFWKLYFVYDFWYTLPLRSPIPKGGHYHSTAGMVCFLAAVLLGEASQVILGKRQAIGGKNGGVTESLFSTWLVFIFVLQCARSLSSIPPHPEPFTIISSPVIVHSSASHNHVPPSHRPVVIVMFGSLDRQEDCTQGGHEIKLNIII